MSPAPAASLAAVALVAACGGAEERPGDVPRRSVLVITLDTVRRDFVGWMGMAPSPTPNLDRLAAGAVIFDDSFTTAPLTLPAHSSLFTGLYPHSHGVRDNGTFKLPPAATTLAEILHEQGYGTGANVAAFVLDPLFGLDQGFARYRAPPRRLGQNASSSFYAELPAQAVVDRAIEDLAALTAKPPFCYWLHLFDAHFPYQPPGPPPFTEAERASPEALARAWYAAEIRHLDAELGRLFAWLDARGWLKELVVVVASDHGEGLDDAPERAHGHYLFDPTVRIPMFLRDPELAPRRCGIPVSLVDVVPTLLARLGIETPELRFDGLDLSPWLEEAAGKAPREPAPLPERVLALESWYVWFNYCWAPYEGCTAGPLKYVHSARDALFDRNADPRETTNLFAPDEPRALGLRRRLDALQRTAVTLEAADHDLTSAQRSLLQSLGYAGGSGGGTLPDDWSTLPDAGTKTSVLQAAGEAVVALERGDTAAALARMRELVQLEPRSAALREQLAALLLDAKPPAAAEAARELDEALQLDPRRASCWFRRAVAASVLASQAHAEAKRAGERERCEKLLRECLRLEPSHPEALTLISRILVDRHERRHRADPTPATGREIAAALDEVIDFMTRLLATLDPDAPERHSSAQVLERVRKWQGELRKG